MRKYILKFANTILDKINCFISQLNALKDVNLCTAETNEEELNFFETRMAMMSAPLMSGFDPEPIPIFIVD